MTNKEMPAAEANSYELAFHVLPTVAEGEVATVFQSLKDTIIKHGGVITAEEAPARIDLAYEVVKYLEGRNRKFSSAYFGWIRFTIDPAKIDGVTQAAEGAKELLRHLLIKLTKVEEEHPFFFHEALRSLKSETISLDLTAESEGEPVDAESEELALEGTVSVDGGEAAKDKV